MLGNMNKFCYNQIIIKIKINFDYNQKVILGGDAAVV
jgi:hypothetical protein